MKILVACECNGRVRRAFRRLGHDAWSCDLKRDKALSSFHYQGDVRNVLEMGWDMMIGFPPCTYVCRAGNRWRNEWEELGLVDEAIEFFRELMRAPIPRIALENPSGILSTVIGKPQQRIEPYWFGHPWSKQTCLWLKNLPPLRPTKIVTPKGPWVSSGSVHFPGSKRRQWEREATFPGIAKAMGEQWGRLPSSVSSGRHARTW